MQLERFWNRKKSEPSLDTVPLKKVVAVSDEYWVALYSPIIDCVSRSLGVFQKHKRKLYDDYVEQFVRLIRRSKGVVQEDPLLVHLHTFSLSVAFSSIYVARLCHSFDFTGISSLRKTKGNRTLFFPWISVPLDNEIRLSKVRHQPPAYVHAVSIFNVMMNDNGWKWLHSNPEILKGLLDAIYTNGEKGPFSGILSNIKEAPIGGSLVISDTGLAEPVVFDDNDISEENCSLDELIVNLGGSNEDISIEDLLDNSTQESKKNATTPLDEIQVSQAGEDNNDLDLSIFEDETGDDHIDKSESLEGVTTKERKRNSSDDALAELSEFLATTEKSIGEDTAKVDDLLGVDVGDYSSEELLFSHESSITTDLVNWCLKQVNHSFQCGVYAVMNGGNRGLFIERDKGIMAFVHQDYDLENEAEYRSVADEVLTDLSRSNLWVENNIGGETWKMLMEEKEVSGLFLRVDLPSSCVLVDEKLYTWLD